MPTQEIPVGELVDGTIFSPDAGRTWFVAAGSTVNSDLKVYAGAGRDQHAPWITLPMAYGPMVTTIVVEGIDTSDLSAVNGLFMLLGMVTLELRQAGVPDALLTVLRRQITEVNRPEVDNAEAFRKAYDLLSRTVSFTR